MENVKEKKVMKLNGKKIYKNILTGKQIYQLP
jgi:hypothetical protein